MGFVSESHPVVFGHPWFPDRRQEPLQLRKAFSKELRPPLFCGGERERTDGLDVTLGDEADLNASPLAGGDAFQERFNPTAAP
jgi:hypothetical protein